MSNHVTLHALSESCCLQGLDTQGTAPAIGGKLDPTEEMHGASIAFISLRKSVSRRDQGSGLGNADDGTD